jgi:hypothetical protein
MLRANRFVAFAIVVCCLSGCVSPTQKADQPVHYGTIATPNIVITAEDNSFTLRSGEKFTPPFQSSYNLSEDTGPKRAENWPYALKAGAKRVTVQYGNDRLFGVLALNYHYAGMTGPGADNYRIEIPREFVEAAKEGRCCVVYELAPVPNRGEARFLSWTLWLSDQPFRE